MVKSLVHHLTLSGAGETKEAAFNQIFLQVKSKIAREVDGLPLRIEPQNVEILQAKKTFYTERFLGIFFPRTRTRYEITAKITVQVRMIDVEKIEFETEEKEMSPLQHLIRME
ncbi:DUF4312 family protein [Paenactinomyces guangxiensis]|uniref:DUF4312 family protein n=1 Tax=Paenactinomyces guangxiensis TaxID=1490290 RepID=A0A7W1WPX3_9BACL|nr:DUF4312 family protein [Paenactinomyces guangxiensis]MBA4493900.1 DUF4312 family protein [Paenactinomyces guangxiensis]MBH8591366.1 DUF4312 family protein [Paenactinomyces guangxiensis]